MILNAAVDFALACVALAFLLCAWRLWRGPGAVDRVLALDTLALQAVALVLLLGWRWQTTLHFEPALMIAMLGFVSTAALARWLTRGDVAE